jgi:hypothetical protein
MPDAEPLLIVVTSLNIDFAPARFIEPDVPSITRSLPDAVSTSEQW